MFLTPGKRQIGLAVTVAALAPALFAACSGDDDASTPTPTSSASAPATTSTSGAETPVTGTGTASSIASTTTAVTATATAQPTTPSAVADKATTAGFFLYVARDGDTIDSIARAFNGEPGTAKAGYPDQIRELNQLTDTNVPAGQVLVIPLLRTGTDLIPGAGIAAAANAAGSAGKVDILEPGATTLTTYGRMIVLHKVELAVAPARGYRLEYWLTDAPTLGADGSFNQDAKVTKPLMVIATGMPAGATGDTTNIARDGNTYTVTALAGATSSAIALAADLVVAPTGP